MRSGERQVAPKLSGIRRDHLARYEWAARMLPPNSRVVDCACGVGYGAFILAQAGHTVLAIDNDAEALAYGREFYAHPGITYSQRDAASLTLSGHFEAATCFETIEHLEDPLPMLRAFRRADRLLASVPNEAVFPFRGYAYHHRHYTRPQFFALLREAGWEPEEWHGQAGPESEVEPEIDGRTLIVTSKPADAVAEIAATIAPLISRAFAKAEADAAPVAARAPEHVAIIGLGPSCSAFFDLTRCLGGMKAYCDEVWGINAIGGVLDCDRIFHMDDLLVQERRAEARPESNIAEMVKWLKRHPGPVYTSVVRPGYPGLVAFPLEDVLNGGLDTNGGAPYFNSTAAYAIAYAVHIGVKRISLFGMDYTLPNIHAGERGRACCEFWLGIAAARGIEISIPDGSTLLDACAPPEERLYGYDCVEVHLKNRPDGSVGVSFLDRDVPTAAEVEARYDHKNVHPNRLLAAE